MNEYQFQDAHLWPVKIRTGKLDLSPETNAELARIVKGYDGQYMARYDSGFKHNVTTNIYMHNPSPAVDEWFAKMKEMLELYLFEVAGLSPGDITRPRFNCFGSMERRGQWAPPHAHHGNQVVLTYYPEVVRNPEEPHPYAGSVFFHNPTSMQSGFWARRETGFWAWKPESGSFMIFPGHALHSTSPFFCEDSLKCALVTNVRFAGSLEGDDPQKTYCYESEIEERREALKGQA